MIDEISSCIYLILKGEAWKLHEKDPEDVEREIEIEKKKRDKKKKKFDRRLSKLSIKPRRRSSVISEHPGVSEGTLNSPVKHQSPPKTTSHKKNFDKVDLDNLQSSSRRRSSARSSDLNSSSRNTTPDSSFTEASELGTPTNAEKDEILKVVSDESSNARPSRLKKGNSRFSRFKAKANGSQGASSSESRSNQSSLSRSSIQNSKKSDDGNTNYPQSRRDSVKQFNFGMRMSPIENNNLPIQSPLKHKSQKNTLLQIVQVQHAKQAQQQAQQQGFVLDLPGNETYQNIPNLKPLNMADISSSSASEVSTPIGGSHQVDTPIGGSQFEEFAAMQLAKEQLEELQEQQQDMRKTQTDQSYNSELRQSVNKSSLRGSSDQHSQNNSRRPSISSQNHHEEQIRASIKHRLLEQYSKPNEKFKEENEHIYDVYRRSDMLILRFFKEHVLTMQFEKKQKLFDTIGEMSMNMNHQRTTTIYAKTDLYVLMLDQKSYEQVFADLIEELMKWIIAEKDRDQGIQKEVGEIEDMDQLNYKKQIVVASVIDGHFFGEEFFNQTEKRQFTVRSQTNLILYFINNEILSRLPSLMIQKLEELAVSKNKRRRHYVDELILHNSPRKQEQIRFKEEIQKKVLVLKPKPSLEQTSPREFYLKKKPPKTRNFQTNFKLKSFKLKFEENQQKQANDYGLKGYYGQKLDMKQYRWRTKDKQKGEAENPYAKMIDEDPKKHSHEAISLWWKSINYEHQRQHRLAKLNSTHRDNSLPTPRSNSNCRPEEESVVHILNRMSNKKSKQQQTTPEIDNSIFQLIRTTSRPSISPLAQQQQLDSGIYSLRASGFTQPYDMSQIGADEVIEDIVPVCKTERINRSQTQQSKNRNQTPSEIEKIGLPQFIHRKLTRNGSEKSLKPSSTFKTSETMSSSPSKALKNYFLTPKRPSRVKVEAQSPISYDNSDYFISKRGFLPREQRAASRQDMSAQVSLNLDQSRKSIQQEQQLLQGAQTDRSSITNSKLPVWEYNFKRKKLGKILYNQKKAAQATQIFK